MPPGCGALVDTPVNLVVTNFDGTVALLGKGQEGQRRRGAQAESPTAAAAAWSGTATRRGVAAASVAGIATHSARSTVDHVHATLPACRRAAGRRHSGRGWRAPRDGGASVAVVSMLKPAV